MAGGIPRGSTPIVDAASGGPATVRGSRVGALGEQLGNAKNAAVYAAQAAARAATATGSVADVWTTVFAKMGSGLRAPSIVAKIAAGNAHGKAGGQAMPARWEGGRSRTRFSPLHVRRFHAEHSEKGVWVGGLGWSEGGAQSSAEGFPTAFYNHHPGIVAVGGTKGPMESSVQGKIPAPASDAGRVYCRVGRGTAALARRIQYVGAAA